MVIIQPATWLINVRRTGKAKLYDSIKSRLGNHVYKVVIENLNKEFDTAMYVPFSITYIDLKNEFSEIDFWCCGEHRVVDNLYDCNMIGSYEMIWSILNKIKSYGEKVGTMKDHIYKEGKTVIDKETWFCKYGQIIGISGCCIDSNNNYGGNHSYTSNSCYITHLCGDYTLSYLSFYYHYKNTEILNRPICRLNAAKQETDRIGENLYGTKTELENWKHFVFNNSLPLFVSICLVIDQNNTVKDYIPWLVDKQYTDSEIYQLLGITEDEQKFIDRTIQKYERHSPWFKRYMCGKKCVSEEEI